MHKSKFKRPSFRPGLESCEPRLLLTGVANNDVMEIGTNLNFVYQADHINLLSQPSGDTNANGTLDSERMPFVFRNAVDWSNAYNYDAQTGLSTTSPWRQEFLDDLDIYTQLRFMHWTNTNGSGVETWSQRTDPNSDQSNLSLFGTSVQGVRNGIAWEWIVDLGNRLGKDIWINIPLKADDAYVQNLSNLLEERLDPSLKVYVEYHNEIWLTKGIADDTRNSTQYANDMAIAKNIDDGMGGFGNVLRWQSHRSAEIWKMFRTEFGSGFDSRVVKVVAGQGANVNLGEQIRDLLRDPSVNTTSPIELEHAYAIAPYFASAESITDPDDFAYIDSLAQAQVAQAESNVLAWDVVGTPVIAYEGGQHITGAHTDDAILQSVNFDPRLKDVYLNYLDGLENAGLESFAHFTHSGVKVSASNNGDHAWGAKAYIGQPAAEAPKYAALAEFAGETLKLRDNVLLDGAIATYDTAGSVPNTTSFIEPNAPWVPEVIAGDLELGAGVQATNGSYPSRFAPKNWDSTTLADAIAADEYISFDVSVGPDALLDVNGIDVILNTQSQSRNFALLSSASGFDPASTITDFGGPITGVYGQAEVNVDLQGKTELEGLSGTIEFRIYAFGGTPNTYESVGIGDRDGFDLKLYGKVLQHEVILEDAPIGSFETLGSKRMQTTELESEGSIVPVEVSELTPGSGVSKKNAWYWDRFAPRKWTSTTLAGAITADEYLSFSVDVDPGYSLDVTEINAYLFTQNQRARNFVLLSSATGFTELDVLSDFGGTVTGSGGFGQEDRTATLSQTNDLQGSVEFRIYVYGAQNANQWEAVGLGNRVGDELSIVGTLYRTAGGTAPVFAGGVSSFDTTGSIKQSTTSIADTTDSPLFTTTDLAPGPGLSATNGWYNNRFAPINWNSATLADAITNDDYLTFSLTVAPGASVDITEIDAYLFTQNKKSRTFALMSGATGFTSADVLTDFGGSVTGSSNYGQESRTADLPSAGLQGLSGTIEFRLYVYGTVNLWEAVGLGDRAGDELTLSGTVSL